LISSLYCFWFLLYTVFDFFSVLFFFISSLYCFWFLLKNSIEKK
jgi:hypothetical protein